MNENPAIIIVPKSNNQKNSRLLPFGLGKTVGKGLIKFRKKELFNKTLVIGIINIKLLAKLLNRPFYINWEKEEE